MKKILRIKNGEKNIFICGDADFSADIKRYITEHNVLVFRFAGAPLAAPNTDKGRASAPPTEKPDIDLVVLGECKKYGKNLDIASFGNVKSVLLNIENSRGINCSDQAVQIITCGLKEKDTAIFSSINLDEGSVIFDLQRSVKNIDGETVEPFEKQILIPEFAKKESSEDLILPLTALMLCGRI